jgi:hypothetical protein
MKKWADGLLRGKKVFGALFRMLLNMNDYQG